MSKLAPPPAADGSVTWLWKKWFASLYSYIGGESRGTLHLPLYKVADTPPPDKGAVIFVIDEVGGSTIAFGDGTNWRRVQDRNIIA